MPKPLPMLALKKSASLEQTLESELKNLKSLDTLAWMQIGNYMADLRNRINGYLEKTEPGFPTLDPLCALLSEMDTEYEKQIRSNEKNEKELMGKLRIQRFLRGMRIQIGNKIRDGQIHLEPIEGNSPSWPRPRKPIIATPTEYLDEKIEPAESEEDLVSNWMKEGFPID